MNKERELLEFQIQRGTTNLYKSFLVLLEGLSEEHKNQFEKLKKAMPEKSELLSQAEYLDEAQLNYLRKKVLDSGNELRRELMTCMQNFEINFKK